MTFHRLEYLLFLVIVLLVYWQLGKKAQNLFLLAASYFFYGFIHPWFLSLLLFSSVTDYLGARGIRAFPARGKIILIVCLSINLGLLAIFKYFGFFVENVQSLLLLAGAPTFNWSVEILLPVGISFYTFQSMSYTIDVYRKELEPERNLPDFLLYVSFFPQLVAGPIERGGNLLPQIKSPRTFSHTLFQSGIVLIVWGLFKKLVIADNVGVIADKVFLLNEPSFFILWCGVFAFCIQIYADFSGYTDMARGSANLLGFRLQQNFNHPFLADSPQDFWKRWHISLSSWIRSYIYIPLGGSRCGPGRYAFNILVVFFLCGLWHGASWNYVIWGLYHGFLILLYRTGSHLFPHLGYFEPVLRVGKIILMFLLANIGWLIFREQDLSHLARLLSLSPFAATADGPMASFLFAQVLLLSIPLWVHSAFAQLRGIWFHHPFQSLRPFYVLTASLLFLAILVIARDNSPDFIYFKF